MENGISMDGHGSNCYRAPELIKEKEYSDKTDIWAFGCVMIEVASSGRRIAFSDDYIAKKYHEGATGYSLPQLEPEDNTALDESSRRYFNSLLKQCLEPNPKDRPKARKLLESLVSRQV
jgi:serine/threonine protein kinase